MSAPETGSGLTLQKHVICQELKVTLADGQVVVATGWSLGPGQQIDWKIPVRYSREPRMAPTAWVIPEGSQRYMHVSISYPGVAKAGPSFSAAASAIRAGLEISLTEIPDPT